MRNPCRFIVSTVVLSYLSECKAGGITSRLQIHIPKELSRPNGYDHREALFGLPPYGGSIQQSVYYADSDLCDGDVDTHKGYPERHVHNGVMDPWPTPYILMVDRGDCTFVTKVRNAQRSGAAGVIIADDTCLCANTACVPPEGETCESQEPIMADDGSGSDISIPSFLMFKEDADPVIEVLKQNQMVRMEMAWSLPAPDDRVEYELWTTPSDIISQPFQKEFKEAALALGSHARFTPHMYIYDGVQSGCQGPDGENQCFNLCTNNGRYCALDPDDDFDSGVSGADVVTESLRRICIWNNYGDHDGIGEPWWNYIIEFMFRCHTDEFFKSQDCARDAMTHANINYGVVEKCMDDSGGLDGDNDNDLLDAELANRDMTGVVVLPSMYINQAPIRGALTFSEVFRAICSGYAHGSEPHICQKCARCQDEKECVLNKGHCKSNQDGTVSIFMFAVTLGAVVFCFGIAGAIQWRRSQLQMRAQVRGILAEYMPLDEEHKAESLGIPETGSSDADGTFS